MLSLVHAESRDAGTGGLLVEASREVLDGLVREPTRQGRDSQPRGAVRMLVTGLQLNERRRSAAGRQRGIRDVQEDSQRGAAVLNFK